MTSSSTSCRFLIIPTFLFLVLLLLLVSNVSSFEIKPKSWTFRGHPIAYEEATTISSSSSSSSSLSEPILLLNGFGVGSFHQHRLIQTLLQKEQYNGKIYGIDYLGQGKSWPIDCQDGFGTNEVGLIYSADTWANQLINFIEEVILSTPNTSKVHLVGNSVGGYLSVIIASRRPDLISTISLLNATPVWGLNLPFWSGVLPPPSIPKKIGAYLFDRIRDLNTLEKYLEVAYENQDAFGMELVEKIRGCTEGKGGHAAFASILWSPPASIVGEDGVETNKPADFYSLLATVQCDVLLLFGSCDPWCTPSFAKRMYHTLNSRQQQQSTSLFPSSKHEAIQRYVALENIGHCPNHEAPVAVARTLHRWIKSNGGSGVVSRDVKNLVLVDKERDVFEESDWGGKSILREVPKEESMNGLGLVDKLITSLV